MNGSVGLLADASRFLDTWAGPLVAFAAGIVSFASPCVLPLVPGYLSFVTGGAAAPDAPRSLREQLLPVLLFVAGFTAVFVAVGALVTRINIVELTKGTPGRWIGGAFVITVGLLMIGYGLRLGPLAVYAERRPMLEHVRPGPWSGFPLGMAFAAGWTPCVGPVLAAIFALAAGSGTTRGVLLLLCYSLGLGVPFLLLGVGVQRLMGVMRWVRRYYAAISVVSGSLLVAVGILLASGTFTRAISPLLRWSQQHLPGL
jgi:cytochrome c-type biogenesis protein